MRRLKTVLLTLTVALLLSGCFRIEQGLKVHDDGRLSFDQVVAMDLDSLDPAEMGFEGGSIPAGAEGIFCAGVRDGIAESLPTFPAVTGQDYEREVSDYNEDGFCGAKLSMDLPASADHSVALSTIFEAPTTLIKTGDLWKFDTSINPEDIDAGSSGFDTAQLAEAMGSAEIRLIVELPGQAIDGAHNADSVKDGKFIWNIDPLGPRAQLFAATEPGSGSSLPISPKILAVIAVNLAILGGLAWFFLRSDDAAAVAADAAIAPTAGSPVGTGAATAPATDPATPYFDETYGIWMINDPHRGLLWHREATDEWVAF